MLLCHCVTRGLPPKVYSPIWQSLTELFNSGYPSNLLNPLKVFLVSNRTNKNNKTIKKISTQTSMKLITKLSGYSRISNLSP